MQRTLVMIPAMLAGGVFLVEARKRVLPTDGTRVKRAPRAAPKAMEGLAEPALPLAR